MRQRIFLWMMVLAVAIIFSAASVYAGTVSLPKTGQGRCFDDTGNQIANCTGTGQDGDTLAGVDWPTTRFTNLDGTTPATTVTDDCVIDQLTGLTWTRAANLSTSKKWGPALAYPGTISTCGYTDWRLPNVNELESLIHYDAPNPANWLNVQGFTGVQAAVYWTSTTYFRYSPPDGNYYGEVAWVVSMAKSGALEGGYYGNWLATDLADKDDSDAARPNGDLYIWPVRGGAGL